MPYLKYLNEDDAEYALKEVDEGICKNHLEAKTIAY